MRTHTFLPRWTARLLAVLALPAAYACDGDPDVSEFECESPTPHLGRQNGFEQCASGFVHRTAAITCESSLPRPGERCGGEETACHSDADCTEKASGYCSNDFQAGGCACNYGCVTDADCGAGSICLCGGEVGVCVNADCATDDDCAGGLCAQTKIGDCGATRFVCQSPDDACGGDSDCAPGERCVVPELGQPRACRPMTCNGE